MTKTELEAFLAVLQYGSISAAAERLFITQPAMSHRMKSMEEELGYSLFERGRGSTAGSKSQNADKEKVQSNVRCDGGSEKRQGNSGVADRPQDSG